MYMYKKKKFQCVRGFLHTKVKYGFLPFDLEQQKKVWHMEEGRPGIFRTSWLNT